MLNQRRRHFRWRMYLTLLVFLGLIRHSEVAPTGVSESSSPTSPAKRKSQDIGSLSDFTWQAWLLVDTQTGSQPGMDSATLLRRITPKSVFIAPALPACADGYRADNMDRCVKSVNIDENAHIGFLLQRLNAIYANPQASKDEKKQPTGPLQLNIPLVSESETQAETKVELEETFSMNDPVVVPAQDEIQPNDKKATPQEAMMTVYKIKNDTTSNEDETMFFLGNSTTGDVGKDVQKPDTVVPVAEFVEETNGTDFSEVVDYKIPTDLTTLLNTTSVKRLVSNVEEDISITDKQENTTEVSNTTKLPDITLNPEMDDLPLEQNNITDHVIAQISNFTSNLTMKETHSVSVDSVSPPVKKITDDPVTEMDELLNNETHVEIGSEHETSKFNESQETDFLYDDEEEDEEYLYSTDMPDEEESELEGEEILKHGEAGITIPTRNIERMHHDQQANQTENQKETIGIRDQIVIRFNDSMSTMSDKDEVGSNVSSEVSIDGDLILETTLLDVNTEKLQITTKLPDISHMVEQNDDNDSKESLAVDESHSSEPQVVFSPQNSHGSTSTTLHGGKRTEQLVKAETHVEKNEESEVASSLSASLMYNLPDEHLVKEIHITDEASNTKENMLKKSSKTSNSSTNTFQSGVPLNNFKHTSMNFGSAEDYVRFPDYLKQTQGYVRFPSNEANSIHSQTYKQYPSDDGLYGSTSTKSSVPIRQKPVYYLAEGPSWKNHQQSDHISSAATQRQKQRPLLRFWSKMPLVRDPGIYPIDESPDSEAIDAQEQSLNRFLRTPPSRKRNFYSEMSSQGVNRVSQLSQKLKTPIGG